MAPWTREHRVFVVENYIKICESVIAVQRLFSKQFNVERRGNILDRNTILRRVDAFRTTGSVMKKKPPGLPASVRTPENVERVRFAVLNNFLLPELRRRRVNNLQMWFQQDNSTAHTARASMQVVGGMFPQHVISRFGDIPWPPRSPDLSVFDYFLWGYLKSKACRNKPRNIQDPKDSIRQDIATVG
ncbi:hypothetical protein L798_01616 [Zootermopsis nevadensis]|uniref:DUF4817 domain-containing protein n=1 Tax=Zootermopsis nevadensis TaxID=136037 RepID=A0A067QJW2_ZOONE|nr:hypothetical protein L798_01616 [Zootermopsis nevadensis]